MKKILIMMGAVILWTGANAQQERQLSHYMYDLISVNPGSAGSTTWSPRTPLWGSSGWASTGSSRRCFNMDAPFKLLRPIMASAFHWVWRDRLQWRHQSFLCNQFSVGNGARVGISGTLRTVAEPRMGHSFISLHIHRSGYCHSFRWPEQSVWHGSRAVQDGRIV
jgi:hypothetical protein